MENRRGWQRLNSDITRSHPETPLIRENTDFVPNARREDEGVPLCGRWRTSNDADGQKPRLQAQRGFWVASRKKENLETIIAGPCISLGRLKEPGPDTAPGLTLTISLPRLQLSFLPLKVAPLKTMRLKSPEVIRTF
jgi:hypothetical protein